MSFIGKRVLITGVCGTIGVELLRQMAKKDCKEIIGIDNNESSLFFVDQDFQAIDNINLYVCDITNYSMLDSIMKGIDIVFHAAALKHVELNEKSPNETVNVNIRGVQNIIAAAKRNTVDKVIFTSSDKAVNPTSVMGTTKLMGERLITAANSTSLNGGTIFSSTRFGNVLGSSGSVIPIFKRQLEKKQNITVTDFRMTRFVMTVEQSAELVIDSYQKAYGGEVFITKMPIIRIVDLAEVMRSELAPKYGYSIDDIDIVEVGVKPGEKLYEELMSDEETRRSLELEQYFSVLPAFRAVYKDIDYVYPDLLSSMVRNPYNSSNEQCMSLDELRDFLLTNKLI
jgi:FlaA1/EpsC-like NDP-sugar epimerase